MPREAGKIEGVEEVGEGAGKKETLHNKNALNYRMKPSSNCVIRLFLSPSSLAFERLFRVIVRVK